MQNERGKKDIIWVFTCLFSSCLCLSNLLLLNNRWNISDGCDVSAFDEVKCCCTVQGPLNSTLFLRSVGAVIQIIITVNVKTMPPDTTALLVYLTWFIALHCQNALRYNYSSFEQFKQSKSLLIIICEFITTSNFQATRRYVLRDTLTIHFEWPIFEPEE